MKELAYMRKQVLLWMMLLVVGLHASADDKVEFTASAPDAVAVGDQFRLSYTVTTQNVKDFRIPSITDFEVLMGPSSSRQVSSQITNGHLTSTSSITFTYILLAKSEGEFSIPPASITADGNQMISNSVKIKVLPADETSKRSNRSSVASNTSVSDDDLFVTVSASKTSVYEQEAFLLTYKIYCAVDLRGFENVKLPDFKGFHSQEIELPNDRTWNLEHYKGRNYRTTIYRQFVLFPQQPGKLSIDAARFDASIAKPTAVTDPFEAFFNGGANYVEVKKPLVTSKLVIESKPLPAQKPENFSGGVGDFSITSSISNLNVKANDAVTVKLVISGVGNLKLISTPEIQFPADFEVYDPKVDNQSRLTSRGLSGNVVVEYLAIPRTAGDYKIPGVKFSYFDIKSQTYKTLTTEDYALHVGKGAGGATTSVPNYVSQEELKVLNSDIRFIEQGSVTLNPKGVFFFGSLSYWLYYLVFTAAFVILFVIYRKQIAENSNVARMRTKKANKIAVKRMKLAGKLLSENQKEQFYDEVLRALWGYVSDKLNIPLARLSKDNVEEELRRHGVDDSLIKEFLDVLNGCEFARYAPGDDNLAMDKIYTASLSVISKMENSIKR